MQIEWCAGPTPDSLTRQSSAEQGQEEEARVAQRALPEGAEEDAPAASTSSGPTTDQGRKLRPSEIYLASSLNAPALLADPSPSTLPTDFYTLDCKVLQCENAVKHVLAFRIFS